jgi:DNA-binding MarR family transcriptional regulator
VLTDDERDAWLVLASVLDRLPAVLDSQLRRAADLTHFDYRVLATLATTGHGLAMTTLAERTDATLTRLSHAVRRLEDRDLVRRSPCREDGRVTLARLTTAGRQVVDQVEPGHLDHVRYHVLDPLTPAQVHELRGIGEALLARLGGRRPPRRHRVRG